MGLVNGQGEVSLQQRSEAECFVAEKLRADHGVDEIRDREAEVAMQNAQVVVGAVQHFDDRAIRQDFSER